MFIPRPSLAGDDEQIRTPDGHEIGEEKQIDSVTLDSNSVLNGTENDHKSDNNDDCIELSHDIDTGITCITTDSSEEVMPSSGEGEGDPMDQCAMWNAIFANADEDIHNQSNDAVGYTAGFGGGDIWSTEAFAFESPLKDLLDSNNFSLVKLLAQDELLQELSGCETRLVEYFSKPDVVAGLVECMVCEVPYANIERGKDQWCKEETARRAHIDEENQRWVNTDRTSFDESYHDMSNFRSKPRALTVLATTNEMNDDPHVEASWNSPVKTPKHDETPEDEYDLRFVRYPYMACEVLCSDIGATLDILVDGYVEDIIDDDDDSLLNDCNRERNTQDIEKLRNDLHDNIRVDLDNESKYDSTSEPAFSGIHQIQRPCDLDLSTIQRNATVPRRRILNILFSVLIDTPAYSLDDRRAGYFEKLLVVLFRKRPQAMSDYMNSPLIITTQSAEIGQEMLLRDELGASHLNTVLASNGISTTYTSLLPFTNSFENDREQQPSPQYPPQTPNSDNLLPMPLFFPHANLPPMLLCALFDQIHSHSIMHIIQNLLIPSPRRPQRGTKVINPETCGTGITHRCSVETSVSDSKNINLEVGNPGNAINHHLMSNISQINHKDNQIKNSGMEEDELGDDDVENSIDNLFQCDWSDQPKHALELLLSRLEGCSESFLIKYRFPIGYHDHPSKFILLNDGESSDVVLACSQHIADILVSIIQKSPLDSPAMINLASDPFMSRILDMITQRNSTGSSEFVAHESAITCSMMILESLILQLGGCGAVNKGCSKLPSTPPPVRETDTSFIITELGPHTPATSPSLPLSEPSSSMAKSSTLIRHLPPLIEELSMLLVHPVTKTWRNPAQYTHHQPRPILGVVRLRILRLIESLVLLGDPLVDLILKQSDCLECCLDLFWDFEWCSMLHQCVTNSVVNIIEGGDQRAGLQDYLLNRCCVLEKLMDSFGSECSPEVVGGTNPIDGGMVGANQVVMTAPSMKNMYKSSRISSSMESHHDSEIDSNSDRHDGEDGNGAMTAVSEDDVESAMDKEAQDNEVINDMSRNATDINEVHFSNNAEPPDRYFKISQLDSTFEHSLFLRKGYMGHVIIICQSIVNSCSNNVDQNKIAADQKTSSDTKTSDCSLIDETFLNDKNGDETSLNANRDTDEMNYYTTSKAEFFSPESPIAKTPSSPIAQSPLECQLDQDMTALSHVALIIQHHPLIERWASFVSSTLASEIIRQTTPLGGQNMTKDSGASVGSDPRNRMVTIIDDDSDNDFLGVDCGVADGSAVGEIEMDENDFDIAASMMDALNLPSGNKGEMESENDIASYSIDHNLRNGIMGRESTSGSLLENRRGGAGIGNFGSVIKRHESLSSKEYVYDDPLGCVCPFDTGEVTDESHMHELEADSVSFSKGKEFSERNGGSVDNSGSSDCDEIADEDDEDNVPVLDLFAGNFCFDDSAISPFNPLVPNEIGSEEVVGWANFTNFDDAFAVDDLRTEVGDDSS